MTVPGPPAAKTLQRMLRLRDQTKAAIERGIAFLLDEQRADPNRSVAKRLFGPERR